MGGAIANDIHGKNHHQAGTFGNHITEILLLRSNSDSILCGPNRNKDWFEATIGGIGLTGIILSCKIKLKFEFDNVAIKFDIYPSDTGDVTTKTTYTDGMCEQEQGYPHRKCMRMTEWHRSPTPCPEPVINAVLSEKSMLKI